MKKIFLFKLLASIALFVFLLPAGAEAAQKAAPKVTYISIAPSVTEIIYALGLQDGLLAVSDRCDYPAETKNKPKIGSLYGINKENIIKLKPAYTFALSTTKPFLSEVGGVTKVVYFDFDSVESIYAAIETIGALLGAKERADALVRSIKNDIVPKGTGKSVLYVIQSEPLITIGSKSYLTDVIRLSGNVSATSDVYGYYPSISREYAIKLRPHYVVAGPYADDKILKTFLKESKFVELAKEENDVINRPGPRIGKAVKFFSGLP